MAYVSMMYGSEAHLTTPATAGPSTLTWPSYTGPAEPVLLVLLVGTNDPRLAVTPPTGGGLTWKLQLNREGAIGEATSAAIYTTVLPAGATVVPSMVVQNLAAG